MIISPGESRTAVLGPGGFGKGGSGLWHPPHMSAAKSKTGKRQENALNSRLREDVPANCRSSTVWFLFCVMPRCLLYKIVERQAKCWGPSDRIRIFGFQETQAGLKLSAFAVQPQSRRCPTPFPSPKRHPATIPPADLASKSHQNQRSTPIRFDVMRPRTPNRQSAPSPCGLAAARLAMQGRSGRSFQHLSKHVPENQRPDDNDRQEWQ